MFKPKGKSILRKTKVTTLVRALWLKLWTSSSPTNLKSFARNPVKQKVLISFLSP